jgi:hypothetical protein
VGIARYGMKDDAPAALFQAADAAGATHHTMLDVGGYLVSDEIPDDNIVLLRCSDDTVFTPFPMCLHQQAGLTAVGVPPGGSLLCRTSCTRITPALAGWDDTIMQVEVICIKSIDFRNSLQVYPVLTHHIKNANTLAYATVPLTLRALRARLSTLQERLVPSLGCGGGGEGVAVGAAGEGLASGDGEQSDDGLSWSGTYFQPGGGMNRVRVEARFKGVLWDEAVGAMQVLMNAVLDMLKGDGGCSILAIRLPPRHVLRRD